MSFQIAPKAFLPRFLVVIFFLVFLPAEPALAVKPLQPPLNVLFSPFNRLIVGTLVEINPDGRLVFKREKVYGPATDVPELIDMQAASIDRHTARMGERYIVAYTMFHHDKQYPGGKAPNRKGAVMINSSGLEPAMFPDSSTLRKLLDLASNAKTRESAQVRHLLMNLLAGKDRPLQLLAAGQVAFDMNMGKALDAADRASIGKIARDPKTSNSIRSMLLAAAADRPDELGSWWSDEVSALLETTPLDGYDQGSEDLTELVLLAFDEARYRHVAMPVASVSRWLVSPRRLFVERSNALLAEQYPLDRKKALEVALASAALVPELKTYLADQLRQIESRESNSQAQ